ACTQPFLNILWIAPVDNIASPEFIVVSMYCRMGQSAAPKRTGSAAHLFHCRNNGAKNLFPTPDAGDATLGLADWMDGAIPRSHSRKRLTAGPESPNADRFATAFLDRCDSP